MAIILKTLKASGGDYSLMSTWESEIPLGTLADNYTLECYNDWPDGLEDTFEIVERTTTETNNIVITCPESERFSDHTDPSDSSFDGFRINVAADFVVVRISCEHVIIESIGVYNSRGFNGSNALNISADYATVRYNALWASATGGSIVQQVAAGNVVIHNNISYTDKASTSAYSIRMRLALVYNNVMINRDLGSGLEVGVAGGSVYNNIVIGGTVDDYADDATTYSNNSSDWGSSAHASCVVTDVNSTDFIDDSTFNYHLSETSNLRDNGYNLIENGIVLPPQYDIDGNELPLTGAWDIGAYQYVGGEPPVEDKHFVGALAVDNIMLGENQVDKVMVGSTQVWP